MKNTKRLGKHLVAAGLATMLVTTGLAVSAQGETVTKSAASSRFLSGTIGSTDLDQVAALAGSTAANPGNAGPNANPLQVSVLQQTLIGSPLNLPLAEFLGTSGSAGLANHYAAAPSRTKALGASGAVRDSGGVLTTDSTAFPSNATISLKGGPLDGLTKLADLGLEVGALSGQSEVDGDAVRRSYTIASLGLNLKVGLVEQLLEGLRTVRDAADVDDITLSSASLCQATNNVANVTVEALVAQLTTLGVPAATIDEVKGALGASTTFNICDLTPLGALLTQPTIDSLVKVRVTGLDSLVSGLGELTDGGLTVNLATGEVTLDLAKLLDLNDLPPNTELLGAVTQRLAASVTKILNNLQAALVEKLAAVTLSVTVAGTEVIPAATTKQLADLGLTDGLGDIITQATGALKGPLDTLTATLTDAFSQLRQVLALTANNQTSSTSSALKADVGSIDASTKATVGRFYKESALRIDVLRGTGVSLELAAANAGLQPDEITPPPSETPPPPTTTTGSDDGGVTTTLPNTGAPNVLPFFVLGLVLIAAGASTIITERRREAAALLA